MQNRAIFKKIQSYITTLDLTLVELKALNEYDLLKCPNLSKEEEKEVKLYHTAIERTLIKEFELAMEDSEKEFAKDKVRIALPNWTDDEINIAIEAVYLKKKGKTDGILTNS